MEETREIQEPPHSVQDEQDVLGACLVWPEEWLRPCRAILTDPDFWYVQHHADIFRAMCALQDRGEPVLHSAICRELPNDPWVPDLLDRAALVPTGQHADHQARLIRRFAIQRRFLQAAQQLAEAARSGDANGHYDALIKAKQELDSGDDYKPPTEIQTALELITSPIKPIHYALKPVVALGKLTQVQGEPKGGKSVFVFYMSICMALGYWVAGRFTIENGVKRKVMYLADEDAENLLQMRLRLFFKGLGVGNQDDLLNLVVVTQEKCAEFDFDLTNELSRQAFVNLIKYTGSQVVVLDSLSNFCPVAEENSKKEMQPIMRFLKRTAIKLGIAIIYIHHVAKPSQGVQRSVVMKSRGNSVIPAAWDIMLDWGDHGESDITPVQMRSKIASSGDSFNVHYLPDAKGDLATEVKWSIQDALPTENTREHMQKVVTALKELNKTTDKVKSKTIAEAIGMSDDNVQIYLKAAMKLDKVSRERSDERGKPWLYWTLED